MVRVIFILLLLLAALIAVLRGAGLWMAVRWWKGIETSFAAAAFVAVASAAAHAAVGVGLGCAAGLPLWRRPGLGAIAVFLTVMLIAYPVLCFIVSWIGIKSVYRIAYGRAALANLIMLAPETALVPVFAVLLAFAVKWTTAEAFIIPTGAMATAIYGAHADVTCASCGWPYAVNMSDVYLDAARAGPKRSSCPNCDEPARIVAADMKPGDRILVDKTSKVPRRWDVIVFKSPPNPSLSYVMRAVALPGETLEIADGDLFINGSRLKKPPGAVPELWLPVHDTQFIPKAPHPAALQWVPDDDGGGWKQAGGRFTFDATGGHRQPLRFNSPVTDALAYNNWTSDFQPQNPDSPRFVRDVKITCAIEALSGDGNLIFQWECDGLQVAATVSTTGRVEIRSGEDGRANRRAFTRRALSASSTP